MPAWSWTSRYEPSGLKRRLLSARSGGLSLWEENTSTGRARGLPSDGSSEGKTVSERCLSSCEPRAKARSNDNKRAKPWRGLWRNLKLARKWTNYHLAKYEGFVKRRVNEGNGEEHLRRLRAQGRLGAC